MCVYSKTFYSTGRLAKMFHDFHKKRKTMKDNVYRNNHHRVELKEEISFVAIKITADTVSRVVANFKH
jgi:hypothetical protein